VEAPITRSADTSELEKKIENLSNNWKLAESKLETEQKQRAEIQQKLNDENQKLKNRIKELELSKSNGNPFIQPPSSELKLGVLASQLKETQTKVEEAEKTKREIERILRDKESELEEAMKRGSRVIELEEMIEQLKSEKDVDLRKQEVENLRLTNVKQKSNRGDCCCFTSFWRH